MEWKKLLDRSLLIAIIIIIAVNFILLYNMIDQGLKPLATWTAPLRG